LCPALNIFLPTILGGFIAGIVGVVLSGWQRKRSAKDEFLIFISVKKGAIPQKDIFEFYTTTRPEIREAVSRVIPFLRYAIVQELEIAWTAYDNIDEYDLLDENENELMRLAAAVDKLIIPEKPSEIMKSRLDSMSEIVK
jgi:hypothetical protein